MNSHVCLFIIAGFICHSQKSVFEGVAQEALAECIQSLLSASDAIKSKKVAKLVRLVPSPIRNHITDHLQAIGAGDEVWPENKTINCSFNTLALYTQLCVLVYHVVRVSTHLHVSTHPHFYDLMAQ